MQDTQASDKRAESSAGSSARSTAENQAENTTEEAAEANKEYEDDETVAVEESVSGEEVDEADRGDGCCCGGDSCCHGKTTQRTEEEKKKLLNRLKRIEGQVRGLQAMIQRDAYCNDVLNQSAAVSAAIHAFNRELLSRHIHTCVARDIREGKDQVIDELTDTLFKLMR
jgi:DNA-binding FrmR family transcriptional regulator